MQWCKQNYGHYALFATLRLHTAVIRHDHYDISSFNRAFRNSGKNHENNSRLRDFMRNLDYVDSHNFTTEELRFYIEATSNYRYITDEHIDNEQEAIEQETESDLILDSHAEYLVKAMTYWRLYFKEKSQEWRREFSGVNQEWILRAKLAEGENTQEEEVMAADEGYYSEDESSEDESDNDQ